jgi:hypothetical protein
MSTAAQIRANKQNAKHSTGPRTAEGKQRSSRNAVKHGLRAMDPLIPGEDREAFETHCEEIELDLQPATAIESNLVDQIADITWRLKRLSRIEAAVITEFHDAAAKQPHNQGADTDQLLGKALADDKHLAALNRLGRYEAQLSRRYHRALKEFRDTRQRRIRGLNLSAAFGRLAAKPRPEQPANIGHKSKTTEPTQSIATLLESIDPMNGPANNPDPIPPAVPNLHQVHAESPANSAIWRP